MDSYGTLVPVVSGLFYVAVFLWGQCMVLPVAVAHSSSLLCGVQLGERICSVAGRVGGFQFAVILSSAAVNIILCVSW